MFILQLPSIQEGLKTAGEKILTPLVSLDTPGKATVEVVIPADPVGFWFSLQIQGFEFWQIVKKYFIEFNFSKMW